MMLGEVETLNLACWRKEALLVLSTKRMLLGNTGRSVR
jgi:hypothetical protein